MPNHSIDQLKRALEIAEQIQKLEAQLASILGRTTGFVKAGAPVKSAPKPATKRRTISAEGRARIAAAQKARWAKSRGQTISAPAKPAKGKKRNISPEARAKMAAAAKKRWAAAKAGK